jgi:hypothetical protein
MESSDEDEQAVRKRKWQSARQRLLERLCALGLVYGRDYMLFGEDSPLHGTRIGVADESLVTADFLVACSRALLESEEREWGAVVDVHDPAKPNKMRAIAEISSGSFTAISGGDVTRQAIFEAYHKLGLGHLLSWKP